MHVRSCTPTEIRVPFHVGEDRSRTWVITRTDGGASAEARSSARRRLARPDHPIRGRYAGRGIGDAAGVLRGRSHVRRSFRRPARTCGRSRSLPRPIASPTRCGARARTGDSARSSTSRGRSRRRRPLGRDPVDLRGPHGNLAARQATGTDRCPSTGGSALRAGTGRPGWRSPAPAASPPSSGTSWRRAAGISAFSGVGASAGAESLRITYRFRPR